MPNCNRNEMNIFLVDVSSSSHLFIFRVRQITQINAIFYYFDIMQLLAVSNIGVNDQCCIILH